MGKKKKDKKAKAGRIEDGTGQAVSATVESEQPQTTPAPPVRDTINLTVTADEQYEFKLWCVRHRLSQVKAFKEAFALLQERHGR